MNGRLYDPLVARFLSPDNYVQAPDFTQNFNRYTYCLNNPLKYTDPSGEFAHLVLGAIIGGFINLATHLDDVDNAGEFFGYFLIGAAAGALGAGAAGACSVVADVTVSTSAKVKEAMATSNNDTSKMIPNPFFMLFLLSINEFNLKTFLYYQFYH